MLIGATENGDPSLDYAWIKKMDMVDGTFIITKNLTTQLQNEIMNFKNKIFVHACCTGFGGTIVEPNLPNYEIQLNNVKNLIEKGFPAKQIIIRIDPIIPTEKGIQNVTKVVSYAKEVLQLPINRFRVSVIDMYPHVKKRFEENNLPLPFDGWQATDKQFANLDNLLKELSQKYDIVFESCAETHLYSVKQCGCVSKEDIQLLNLEYDEDELKHQRPTCLCCAAKTELLERTFKEHYGCAYKCLYCYWK